MSIKNNSFVNYFITSWQELKKVNWPSRKTMLNHTLIVVVSSVIAVVLTSAIDYGLTYLVQYLIQSKG